MDVGAPRGYTPRVADMRGGPQWLKNLRDIVGTKRGDQSRVAKEVPMQLSQLQKILSGENLKPQVDTLERIARACDKGLEDVFARPDGAAGHVKASRSVGGGARVEDLLGDLLDYIKTLEGKQRTDFIRAVVAILTTLDHPSSATGSDPTTRDGH